MHSRIPCALLVSAFLWLGFGPGAGVTVARASEEPRPYTRNVAIVIWNGAEILDWGGPSEVFESASRFGQSGDTPAFRVYTVSKTTEPIVSQRFVKVIPQFSIQNAPKPDIIVLPGGGTGSVLHDPEFLQWVGQAARDADVALSVCTGAFILADAGLLDSLNVTTWYGATDALAQRYPQLTVHPGRRFVDNGHVITTAGVSAGIDGSLHLVARLLGRFVADRTAEYMEYHWTPEPYLAKSYSVLNPSLDARGRRMQQAEIDRLAADWDAAIATYESLLQENAEDSQIWMNLATSYYGGEHFDRAGEAYVKAAANENLRRRACYNAACSFARASKKDRAFESLEAAIAAGFSDRNLLQKDGDLAGLRQDPRFDRILANLH